MALNVIYKNRNGTTAEWAASTYILEKGELGVDTTLNIAKIGDGVKTWKDLPTFNDVDISNLVTTNTAQTISGAKLFLDPIQVGGSSNLEDYTKITSTDIIVRAGENASWYKVGNDKLSHGDTTNTYTAILPNKSGTVALLSDIPTPPTNYVTTDTAQTITGEKTFNEATYFETGISIGDSTVGDYLNLAVDNDTHTGVIDFASESGVGCTLTLPNGVGTIATLEDIPTNYVTTDTEQTISGNKTFSKAVSVSTDGDAGFEITGGGNTWKINARTEEGPLNIVGQGAAGANTYQFPNKSGTIALTSDIPSVPSNILTKDNFSTEMADGVKLPISSKFQLGVDSTSSPTTSYESNQIVFTHPNASSPVNRTLQFPSRGGTLALASDIGIVKNSLNNTISYAFNDKNFNISTLETDTRALGFHINSYDDSDDSAVVQFATDDGSMTTTIYGSGDTAGIQFKRTIGEVTYFFVKARNSSVISCAAIFRNVAPNKSMMRYTQASRSGDAYASNLFLLSLSDAGLTLDLYMHTQFPNYTLLKNTSWSASKFDATSEHLLYYALSSTGTSSGTVQIISSMQRLNLYCF